MKQTAQSAKGNYAFIDSQNLNMGVGTNVLFNGRRVYYGWRLDFEKFFHYLQENYQVEKAFLFIGNVAGQEELYESLEHAGYEVIFKPTTSHTDAEGELVVKGNVDTDLVLYAAAKEYRNYRQAIIVTGDGDFLSLCDYLDERGKLAKIIIPNKLRYSQLLAKYSETNRLDFVSDKRKTLQKLEQIQPIEPEPQPEPEPVAEPAPEPEEPAKPKRRRFYYRRKRS